VRNNLVTLLDFQGSILTYEIKADKKQASLIKKLKTPFNTKTKIKHIEFFENEDSQYFTAHTDTENYFFIKNTKQETESLQKTLETSTQDTIFFTTNIEQAIPIKLNEKYEFLKLKVEKQPDQTQS
jgi:pyrroloquinoline quinone (PQQ) biosynthesis protein C